jgi:hypothetical protein
MQPLWDILGVRRGAGSGQSAEFGLVSCYRCRHTGWVLALENILLDTECGCFLIQKDGPISFLCSLANPGECFLDVPQERPITCRQLYNFPPVEISLSAHSFTLPLWMSIVQKTEVPRENVLFQRIS